MKNKIFLSLLTFFAFVNIATAVTFTVNTTADAVDAIPGNGVCLTAAGKCSLRAAIQEANFNANSDIIILPAGTYNISIPGTGEDANLTGDFDILHPLEIRGAGIDTTIINGASLDRVFEASAGKNFILKNMTIRGGNAFAGGEGGGVKYIGNAASVLTIQDVNFFKNRSIAGGAIFAAGNAKVTISGSSFESNLSQTTSAVFLNTAVNLINVSDVLFSNNLSLSSGAALQITTDSAVGLSDLQFDDNDGATTPGSLLVSTSADVNVNNVNISNSRGGGLVITGNNIIVSNLVSSGTICGVAGMPHMFQSILNTSLTNVTVSNSDCMLLGAMAAGAGGKLTIKNLKANNNIQSMVGGIGTMQLASGLDMSIDGLEIIGNTSKGISGGLYLQSTKNLNMKNSKIIDNFTYMTGGYGGAIMTAGLNMQLSDLLVQGNQAELGTVGGLGAVAAAGDVVMNRVSLINNSCRFSSCLAGNLFTQGVNSFFDNSTAVGGSSDNFGGGIGLLGGVLNIRNSTIANNYAMVNGAGVYNGGAVNIGNSIISDNTGSNDCFGNPLTSTNNNIVGDASCGLAGSADQVGVSAKLKPAESFGVFVVANDFQQGSTAIDRGRNATCLAKDQRGVNRPFDGNQDGVAVCDIGAIESDDLCPSDISKKVPGVCGCGTADVDTNSNSITDCLLNQEMKFNLANLRTAVSSLRKLGENPTAKKKKKNNQLKKAVTDQLSTTLAYGNANTAGISVSGATGLAILLEDMNKAVKKSRNTKSAKFSKNKKAALANIDKLSGLI